MSCGRKKKVQSIIIPDGYIQPNETAILEIPKSLQKAPVLYAHPREPNAMANKSTPNPNPIGSSTPVKANLNKTAPARYVPCSQAGEVCNASNRTFGNNSYPAPASPTSAQFSRYTSPAQSTFDQMSGMADSFKEPNRFQPDQTFNQTYQRAPKVIQNTTITKTGPKTIIQSKRITETDTESIISEEITETYDEGEETDFPQSDDEAKMRLRESAKQCGCGVSLSSADRSQVSTGRGRYPGLSNVRSPNFGQTYDNNFTYSTIYDDSDDQNMSSSGEMDTSLLGRVIGGDIPRNIEYPTNYKFKQYDSGGRTIPSQGSQFQGCNDDMCGSCEKSRSLREGMRNSTGAGANRTFNVSTSAPEGVHPTTFYVSRDKQPYINGNESSFDPKFSSTGNYPNKTYTKNPAAEENGARDLNFDQTFDKTYACNSRYCSDARSSGEMDNSLFGKDLTRDMGRNNECSANYKFKQYYSDERTIPSGFDEDLSNKQTSSVSKKITFKPEEVCPCPPEIKQGILPKQYDLSESSTKSSVTAQLVATNTDCACDTDEENATYLVAGKSDRTQIINSNAADLEKIEQAEREELEIELKKWQDARRRLLLKTFEDVPKKDEDNLNRTF